MTGGMDNNDNTLKDAWLLDINSGRWKEVRGVAIGLYGTTQHHSQAILTASFDCLEHGNTENPAWKFIKGMPA